MALRTINILSTFTGFGMLDSAVHCALEERGLRPRTVCYVERESSAAAALVARMGTPGLDRAVVWDDLSTFDGTRWRGVVDILTASPPCQPYSSAGKRGGNDDERSHGPDGDGPLIHLARIIKECDPALVYFENVPEWVMGGHFRRFGEELSSLGYEIQKPLFLRSEDVGAPHRRERVFILACKPDVAHAEHYRSTGEGNKHEEQARGLEQPGNSIREAVADTMRLKSWYAEATRENREGTAAENAGSELVNPTRSNGRSRARWERVREGSEELAETKSPRSERQESTRRTRPWGRAGKQSDKVGNAEGEGSSDLLARREESRIAGASNDGREIPFYPPGRTDYRSWSLVASMDPSRMPSIESGVSVVADGLAFSSGDLLRIGGNGVDPLVAAIAFDVLLDEAFGK